MRNLTRFGAALLLAGLSSAAAAQVSATDQFTASATLEAGLGVTCTDVAFGTITRASTPGGYAYGIGIASTSGEGAEPRLCVFDPPPLVATFGRSNPAPVFFATAARRPGARSCC